MRAFIRNWYPLVLVLAIIVGALCLVASPFASLARWPHSSLSTATLPAMDKTAQGVVDSIDDTKWSYTSRGRRTTTTTTIYENTYHFEWNQKSWSGVSYARTANAAYPVGASVTVQFSSANPQQSCIANLTSEPYDRGDVLFDPILCLVLSIFGMTAYWLQTRKLYVSAP